MNYENIEPLTPEMLSEYTDTPPSWTKSGDNHYYEFVTQAGLNYEDHDIDDYIPGTFPESVLLVRRKYERASSAEIILRSQWFRFTVFTIVAILSSLVSSSLMGFDTGDTVLLMVTSVIVMVFLSKTPLLSFDIEGDEFIPSFDSRHRVTTTVLGEFLSPEAFWGDDDHKDTKYNRISTISQDEIIAHLNQALHDPVYGIVLGSLTEEIIRYQRESTTHDHRDISEDVDRVWMILDDMVKSQEIDSQQGHDPAHTFNEYTDEERKSIEASERLNMAVKMSDDLLGRPVPVPEEG